MEIQRLRNLTTAILHTKIEHVYQDIEYITKTEGIMTHQIPNAGKALVPYLKKKVTETRFWNGEYDITHIGEIDIEPMNEEEKKLFWERYEKLPSVWEIRAKKTNNV